MQYGGLKKRYVMIYDFSIFGRFMRKNHILGYFGGSKTTFWGVRNAENELKWAKIEKNRKRHITFVL